MKNTNGINVFESISRSPLSYLIMLLLDAVLFLFSDILAFALCLGPDYYTSRNFNDYSRVFPIIILFKLLCLYVFELYTRPKYKSDLMTAIYTVKATTSSMIIMTLIAYFFRADSIPRPVILYSWIFSLILIFSWRITAKTITKIFAGPDFFKSRLLIIGSDVSAEKIALRLLNDATVNYKLIGFVRPGQQEYVKDLLGYPLLGSINEIGDIISRNVVDEVVVTSSNISHGDLLKILSSLKNKPYTFFRITSEIYDGIISSSTLCEKELSLVPGTSFHKPPSWYPALKRILDITGSISLLFASLPLLVIIIVFIKSTSRGPVFYLTKRVGFLGKLFIMYKFRTMYESDSRGGIEKWASKSDSRITPIGVLLRRFRLDELPQLINVLKNDMSLIGPRPETRYYVNRLLKAVPLYSERFIVKPGITGWAQVNLGYASSVEESKEKLIYDIYYVQNQSLIIDLLITFKTIKTIITGGGAR